MKIAKNSKEARELIKKAKKGDVIIWDEAGNVNLDNQELKFDELEEYRKDGRIKD